MLAPAGAWRRSPRERDETLALAEHSAGIGIWDMDMDTQMVRGTPQFFSIVGLPPSDELVPIERLRALRHPEDRAKVVKNFPRLFGHGIDPAGFQSAFSTR